MEISSNLNVHLPPKWNNLNFKEDLCEKWVYTEVLIKWSTALCCKKKLYICTRNSTMFWNHTC